MKTAAFFDALKGDSGEKRSAVQEFPLTTGEVCGYNGRMQ